MYHILRLKKTPCNHKLHMFSCTLDHGWSKRWIHLIRATTSAELRHSMSQLEGVTFQSSSQLQNVRFKHLRVTKANSLKWTIQNFRLWVGIRCTCNKIHFEKTQHRKKRNPNPPGERGQAQDKSSGLLFNFLVVRLQNRPSFWSLQSHFLRVTPSQPPKKQKLTFLEILVV